TTAPGRGAAPAGPPAIWISGRLLFRRTEGPWWLAGGQMMRESVPGRFGETSRAKSQAVASRLDRAIDSGFVPGHVAGIAILATSHRPTGSFFPGSHTHPNVHLH